MKKSCRLTGQEFEVAQEDLEFYQRLGVPSPTLHPLERQRQRIAFRNFRSLYRRSCDGTKKQIVSMYDSDAPFPVYDTPHWWSDSWDPYSYGQEVHLERSFLDQYLELAKRVPRFSIMNVNCENCSYSNFALESRNCYLVFGCVRNEDCQYGHIVWDCKDCIDNLYAYRCEWCSNGIDIVGCYNVHFSSETVNCRDSYFLHDCRNCSDCFGCFNLRGKEYCFFNEQLTKEEYKKRIESFLPLSHATIQNCLEWLREEAIAKAVYPPYFGEKCEDVSGNHIYEGKNLEYCFDAKRSEYSKYAFTAFGLENCHDISFTGAPLRYCYNSLTLANCENVVCSHLIQNSNNVAYSEFCFSSHDLFGCIGLRSAEYCILNKQYSKEEYHQLRSRIMTQMQEEGVLGEFFPIASSPFAYSESIAQEYQPLTIERAAEMGLRWKILPQQTANGGECYQIPDSIGKVTDDVLNKPIRCEVTGKIYKVNSSELEFCRRAGLPVPKVCPDLRHERRMEFRVKRELHDRSCAECTAKFVSAYAESNPRQVLCEECYQQRLYS